jgi:hypothetical protein
MTEDIGEVETLFSHFDLAVVITAENSRKEQINLVFPGQPLVAYLSQQSGMPHNEDFWLEKASRDGGNCG